MANKIPQFEDSEPVFHPIPVQSAAEGYEAFAKTLGNISQQSAKKVEEMVEDQSNAMMLKSASQLQSAKVNSQIEMIKHPDQAEKIAQNSATIFENITKESFVNTKDRGRLQGLASDNFNDIRLSAAKVSFDQGQQLAAIAFWDNYPVLNHEISESLTKGDFEKAKILEEGLHQQALNLAKMGAITPAQFSRIRETNYNLYTRADELLKMAANPEGHSAEQFHTVSASPFTPGSFQNTHLPVNHNTQYVAASYNLDRTMSGQLSALYNDQPLNFGVISQGTNHEYEDFKQQWQGVSQVKGAIHSGMPFSQIETRMQALQAKPKLTAMETGEVNYWKSYKARLNSNDGYLQMMTQTTLGGQYTQEYNQKSVAIDSSSKNPSEKFTAHRDNLNNYVGSMVSLGQSQHADPSTIQPIPSQFVNDTQAAFVKDAPVVQALERISYLNPEYRPYLANTMKKPNQATAVYIAGATLGKTDTTFQAQLLEANQDRDYSSLVKTGKNESKDSNIWENISSDARIQTLYKYLGKLPGGVVAQNGLRETAINYVLYRAAKEGDVNLNGINKYIEDFIGNTSKGFDIVEGTRYVFNASSLNLRKNDMDYIADYALSEAYKRIHDGRTEIEFQVYVDLNPLHVVNTPDGRIVVIDKNGFAAVDNAGREAFDHPYTDTMLTYAQYQSEETQKYMSQYFGFTENLNREARLHPGFPFTGNIEGKDETFKKELKRINKANVKRVIDNINSQRESG